MKIVNEKFTQYKHYFIVICSILAVNFVVFPIHDFQVSQKEKLSLLKMQSVKVESLLENESKLTDKLKSLDESISLLESALYRDVTEAKFKLRAQSKVENILTKNKCKIERIGFKGSQLITPDITRWYLELRYKGDGECLLGVTRGLESMKPIVQIDEYNVNHRRLIKEVYGEFNIRTNISIWHQKSEKGSAK